MAINFGVKNFGVKSTNLSELNKEYESIYEMFIFMYGEDAHNKIKEQVLWKYQQKIKEFKLKKKIQTLNNLQQNHNTENYNDNTQNSIS